MTKLICNQQRASAASSALHAYSQFQGIQGRSASVPYEEAMIDLLTDLRHLSARFEIDFEKILRISQSHFEEEVDRPDL